MPIAGPDQARQAVQADVFYNVDVVKVVIDDDNLIGGDDRHRGRVRVSVSPVGDRFARRSRKDRNGGRPKRLRAGAKSSTIAR
jgi:hypothetical protein